MPKVPQKCSQRSSITTGILQSKDNSPAVSTILFIFGDSFSKLGMLILKGILSELFMKAILNDCHVLFFVKVKSHLDILCFVVHNFLPNLLTSKYRQPQLISQYPQITHWAAKSARVAQPIRFMVLDFRILLQNTGHETKDFCFVVCNVNSEKKRLQVIKSERKFSDLPTKLPLCQKTKTDKNE